MQDRPTAAELLAAVREFLEHDVMAAVEGRVQFHTRVAVNALGMVERELQLSRDDEELAALGQLLGRTGTRRELETALAAAIRAGSLDHRRAEVVDFVRASVRHKLEIANPKYLDG